MVLLSKIISKKDFIVSKDANLEETLEIMKRNKNGAAIFIDESKPIGIITESNIVKALKKSVNLKQKAIDFATKKLITSHYQRPIEYAFEMVNEHNIRRIILLDDEKKYIGVVLQEDLFNYIEDDVYKVDLKISHIIKKKQQLITIEQNRTIKEALELMQSNDIGSIIVLERESHIGIITEKDIVNITYNRVDLSSQLTDYISKPLIMVDAEVSVLDAIKLMKEKNIRRLVVQTDSRAAAILTNRDILKELKGNYSRILQSKLNHAKEIMDYIPESIIEVYLSEKQNIIHWMNKKAFNTFGNSYIDRNIAELFAEDEWETIINVLKNSKAVENRRILINEQVYEVSGTKNGNYVKLVLKDISRHEEDKVLLQKEVYKEMNRRVENEYLLMQQSKLATMGEMIGHIAHQWRQPLSQLGGVFMNLQAASEFNNLKHNEVVQKVKEGNKLLKYMSETIEDFRNFFEPNKVKEKFELKPYIENAVNLIAASLSYHHIEVKLEDFDEEIYVNGFASEFSQVALNILNNAKDALVSNSVTNPEIIIRCKKSDEYVKIVFEDNAGGIEQSILDKIFDLYFTTKKERQGSGLGLYMSRLIISSKMDGTIEASNGERGALFSIKLKISQ